LPGSEGGIALPRPQFFGLRAWLVFQVVLSDYLLKDQQALNSLLNAIEIKTHNLAGKGHHVQVFGAPARGLRVHARAE
jgi:hypothetical protein